MLPVATAKKLSKKIKYMLAQIQIARVIVKILIKIIMLYVAEQPVTEREWWTQKRSTLNFISFNLFIEEVKSMINGM